MELQEQKLLRSFQEPSHYSPYSEVGRSRYILNSKRASYKRGGRAPGAGLRGWPSGSCHRHGAPHSEGPASPQRLRVSRWKQDGKELQGPERKEKYCRNTKSELCFTLRRTKIINNMTLGIFINILMASVFLSLSLLALSLSYTRTIFL